MEILNKKLVGLKIENTQTNGADDLVVTVSKGIELENSLVNAKAIASLNTDLHAQATFETGIPVGNNRALQFSVQATIEGQNIFHNFAEFSTNFEQNMMDFYRNKIESRF